MSDLQLETETPVCAECGAEITDPFVFRVTPNLQYHTACLRCCECLAFLDERCTCFLKDGKAYCKEDYMSLFSIRCAKCQVVFQRTEMVMRAKTLTFHTDCFCCVVCGQQLKSGDQFAMRGFDCFCKMDFEKSYLVLDDELRPEENSLNSEHKPSEEHSPTPSSHSGDLQPRKTKGKTRKKCKSTRVRTVLNEKQLHTLKTCYAANPRPDALMKEQLTEMTSLSSRVIRVWFQNKRCKDKKRSALIKEIEKMDRDHATTKKGSRLQGVAMVAQDAVSHEAHLNDQTLNVDIVSYQQPAWKQLSDFALHTDFQTPDFQSLVTSTTHTKSPPHQVWLPQHFSQRQDQTAYQTDDDDVISMSSAVSSSC